LGVINAKTQNQGGDGGKNAPEVVARRTALNVPAQKADARAEHSVSPTGFKVLDEGFELRQGGREVRIEVAHDVGTHLTRAEHPYSHGLRFADVALEEEEPDPLRIVNVALDLTKQLRCAVGRPIVDE
jgi:hypothetical protein